ncbi:hypothetical protein G9A89_007761 [Geosiphon pyriformis]|nr:hypothetical protein G9A89_007761 [Geosiphon pyriformis]
MGACCGNNEEYQMTTKFYYYACLVEHFKRPKQVGKWDNTPCLACKETFLDERIWNNIPGIVNVKAEGVTISKLLEIKNNFLSLPEPEYILTFDVFGNIENDLEEFHEHYQWLAPTREEQKQWLEKINI